jgi:hypothetical protein
MIVRKQTHGYSSQRKYVQGKGFVDSLTSSLRSIGSYVSQNKDLIAKPLLGAVGNLAATGLEEGGKALLTHIINKRTSSIKNRQNSEPLDSKGREILQSIINSSNSNTPVTNIIGSGIKKF